MGIDWQKVLYLINNDYKDCYLWTLLATFLIGLLMVIIATIKAREKPSSNIFFAGMTGFLLLFVATMGYLLVIN